MHLYCIGSRTKGAQLRGAGAKEIMEAIWVAAEMRAGGAISHSALAIDTMDEQESKQGA